MPKSFQAHLHLEFSPGNKFRHQKNTRVELVIGVPKSIAEYSKLELREEMHDQFKEATIEYKQFCGPSSSSRISSGLWMLQPNAPDDSGSITCAYQ
eukprot:5456822-Pyramimonas_sp.AAC.1